MDGLIDFCFSGGVPREALEAHSEGSELLFERDLAAVLLRQEVVRLCQLFLAPSRGSMNDGEIM